MSDTPSPLQPTDQNSLQILQLNTRRSSAVVHSLLNDPSTSFFHFLLIQEPYIFPTSNLPLSHPAWTPFYPHIPDNPAEMGPEDTTIKSLIYVNKLIPTTSLKPFFTSSNCVTALTYTTDSHQFLIVSSYAPPKQHLKLMALRDILTRYQTSPTKHVLIGMDSNLHHPLWNPPAYKHTHREADDLITIMTEAGLSLRSPSGIPTFYPPSLHHANTTIDLFWVSPACFDWVVRCVTDVEHHHSHLSDHAAITSSVRLPTPLTSLVRTARRWKGFDATQFELDLASALTTTHLEVFTTASSQATLDLQVNLLTEAVTASMNKHAPRLEISPGAKRWWDKATLNPLKHNAQRLRRLYQKRRDAPTKTAYIEAAQAYRSGIHAAKRQHWRDFLSSLTPSTLFTASRYATSNFAAPSLAVPPLQKPSGELTSEPEEQADLLFKGTSAPTVPCELDDLLPPPPSTSRHQSRSRATTPVV